MEKFFDILLKWLVPFLCGGAVSVITAIITGAKQNKKKAKAIEAGLRCLLRAEIIRAYEKYMAQGYCPIYAKEALKRAYDSYHGLDGNDIATVLFNKLMMLPTEPPEEQEN